MNKNLVLLFNLTSKVNEILQSLISSNDTDMRKTYFKILSSQIVTNYLNYEVNIIFSEKNRKEFLELFNFDINQIHNYSYNISKFISENLLCSALFQSELIFRFYYSKFKNVSLSKERKIFKIVSFLYEDIENNWSKDECKLIVLLWTIRNTIHTGGIYFENPNGRKIEYKNHEYNFEYGKHLKFLIENDGLLIELISDLLSALNTLFTNEKIKGLGFMEHPIHQAS